MQALHRAGAIREGHIASDVARHMIEDNRGRSDPASNVHSREVSALQYLQGSPPKCPGEKIHFSGLPLHKGPRPNIDSRPLRQPE